ncbi:MAG: sugar ABC transporter ATP-binding protein, partial [Nitrososphaeria archaeon]
FGVRVLNKINIEINSGEILGIIGENGAGKSTLMKIISGIYKAEEGDLYFRGSKIIIDILEAKKLGIIMIPQEFNLAPDLEIYENIFLGNEYKKRSFFIDNGKMIKEAKRLLDTLGISMDVRQKTRYLNVAQKEMVEVARALSYDAKILIFDEPTTVLTQTEIKVLFEVIKSLSLKGITVIYVSHRLREIKELCDRVVIMKDGEIVGIEDTKDISEHEMAKKMVGREISQLFPREKPAPSDDVVMKIENINVKGVLKNINFELRKGEILGFAGLIGAGRTELAETIVGIRKKYSGKIIINNKNVNIKSPSDAIKYGVVYLSEDRQGKGIITSFKINENVTLSSLRNYIIRLIWIIKKISFRKENEKTLEYVNKLNIKASSIKVKVQFLSGGNQQKVSFAKVLDCKPDILIIDEPTRGIDINAKSEIYSLINNLAKSGISCIFISSELEEITQMCNRVLVMHEGEVASILEGEHINEEEIMIYATGLRKERSVAVD